MLSLREPVYKFKKYLTSKPFFYERLGRVMTNIHNNMCQIACVMVKTNSFIDSV